MLGLSLVACTGGAGSADESKAAPADAKPNPAPAPPVDEPTTAVPPEPTPPPPVPAPDTVEPTIAAERGETGSEGTSDGASVDEEPPAKLERKHPPAQSKRALAKKTYGAPPRPAEALDDLF